MANYLLLVFSSLITILNFGCDKEIETVSNEKPYSVLVTKERSYYQAVKAKERLLNLDIQSYLIATKDSIEREWFNIMSGAFVDSASAILYIKELDSLYQLKKSIVFDIRTLVDTFTIVSTKNELIFSNSEKKRIIANKPSIPGDVNDAILKFPENNSFYLNKINIINLSTSKSLSGVTDNFKLDMPRGVTLGKVAKYCNSICEVQYQDNLFDDKVTISIMKIKPDIEWNSDLIFEKYDMEKPIKNFESYAFSLDYSYHILNSGTYLNVSINPIEIKAFETLAGYKVGLTTNRGVYRSYFVLTDVNLEYLIIAQSIQKTEDEMKVILAEVGKSNGLNVYDEFYNAFYILPDEENDEDIFLGYSIDKLGWSYAQNKGYSNWSKAMVGHWNANGYFWNSKFGNWSLGLFDLLTENSQDYIYGKLYSDHKYSNPIDVYGVQGFFVKSDYWWFSNYELNFGIDRFVFAINGDKLSKSEMLKRAERMQLNRERIQQRKNHL